MQHVVRRAQQSEPADGESALHTLDKSILEEIREPLPHARGILYARQFLPVTHDAQNKASVRGKTWPINKWTLDEVVAMMDEYFEAKVQRAFEAAFAGAHYAPCEAENLRAADAKSAVVP